MKVDIGPYRKKGKRRIKVQIQPWDCVCLDHTLAQIILPALKRMLAVNKGAPASVFDLSYQDKLKWGSAAFKRAQERSDLEGHQKWAGIMHAMIWSFDQIARGNPDEPECNPENPKWQEQWRAYEDEVRKGTKLFGEWYQALWT